MKFSTILRLAAIALGIVSATIMARDGFNITLNEYLNAVLTAYDDALTSVTFIVFDPAIKVLFEKVRDWFAIDLQLLPHWKHAFVLVWLFAGAFARAFASNELVPGLSAFRFLWGGFCALLAGVVAGTVPLSDPRVFWGPIACFYLYGAGVPAWIATFFPFEVHLTSPHGAGQKWVGLFWGFGAVFLRKTTVSAIMASSVFLGGNRFIGTLPASGLAALTAFIGVMGLWGFVEFAFRPAGEGDTWWQQWLGSPYARIGLDVLSVLGGAAFITYVAHVLA
ncbi:MAG: hypothetical protein U1E87_01040 [Alphaproteobacteria bacterium]